MQRELEELKKRGRELATRLTRELRDEFKLAGLWVTLTTPLNYERREFDFMFSIMDIHKPNRPPEKAVIDAARHKVKEWEPQSRAQIEGRLVPRLH